MQTLHTALSAVVNLINTVPIEEDKVKPKRTWSSKGKSVYSISSDTEQHGNEDVVDIARHGDERKSKTPRVVHDVCGKSHNLSAPCVFADDPKRNQDNVPWPESANGIALRKLGWYSLPDKYVNQPLANVPRREPTGPTSGSVPCRVPVTKNIQVCTACLETDTHTHTCEQCNLNAILNEPNGQYAYVPMSILLLQEGLEDAVVELLVQPEAKVTVAKVDTLIDTGACANFISKSFSNQLIAAGVVPTTDKHNYKRKSMRALKMLVACPKAI